MIFKLKWFLSGLFLKLFCKKIGFPSYFSFPIFFTGLKNLSIGKNVRIFPGSRFEIHSGGFIKIGDNVGIGQNFHITSGGKLVIGSGTVITANVFVTNIDHDYTDVSLPILEQRNIITDTEIGRNCFIGIGAAIQAGTKLGEHCIVGANSVVKGHFPDFCVIVGAPARIVKKYDFDLERWVSVTK
ncbi:acyltransferase [Aeromonas veronii]|uniref:Putative acetyltransferase n=1 Tax=Aeromonas hydrophila TaxID=644 RepID=A0A346ACV6_AERHY|nr:acyltransferase [Aeromonas veronii]AXL05068.1 putative acetyltransferase [Aeromonas hydrophila]TNI12734.1 lipopolysaccharide biosynthesis protein [Aeromonas veronii]